MAAPPDFFSGGAGDLSSYNMGRMEKPGSYSTATTPHNPELFVHTTSSLYQANCPTNPVTSNKESALTVQNTGSMNIQEHVRYPFMNMHEGTSFLPHAISQSVVPGYLTSQSNRHYIDSLTLGSHVNLQTANMSPALSATSVFQSASEQLLGRGQNAPAPASSSHMNENIQHYTRESQLSRVKGQQETEAGIQPRHHFPNDQPSVGVKGEQKAEVGNRSVHVSNPAINLHLNESLHKLSRDLLSGAMREQQKVATTVLPTQQVPGPITSSQLIENIHQFSRDLGQQKTETISQPVQNISPAETSRSNIITVNDQIKPRERSVESVISHTSVGPSRLQGHMRQPCDMPTGTTISTQNLQETEDCKEAAPESSVESELSKGNSSDPNTLSKRVTNSENWQNSTSGSCDFYDDYPYSDDEEDYMSTDDDQDGDQDGIPLDEDEDDDDEEEGDDEREMDGDFGNVTQMKWNMWKDKSEERKENMNESGDNDQDKNDTSETGAANSGVTASSSADAAQDQSDTKDQVTDTSGKVPGSNSGLMQDLSKYFIAPNPNMQQLPTPSPSTLRYGTFPILNKRVNKRPRKTDKPYRKFNFHHVCGTCHIVFRTFLELSRHQKESGHVVKMFKCPDCTFVCNLRNKVTYHMRKEYHGGLEPFMCKECGQLFPQRDHLEKHSAVHGATEEIQCPVSGCPKKFSRLDVLNRHIRLCHKILHRVTKQSIKAGQSQLLSELALSMAGNSLASPLLPGLMPYSMLPFMPPGMGGLMGTAGANSMMNLPSPGLPSTSLGVPGLNQLAVLSNLAKQQLPMQASSAAVPFGQGIDPTLSLAGVPAPSTSMGMPQLPGIHPFSSITNTLKPTDLLRSGEGTQGLAQNSHIKTEQTDGTGKVVSSLPSGAGTSVSSVVTTSMDVSTSSQQELPPTLSPAHSESIDTGTKKDQTDENITTGVTAKSIGDTSGSNFPERPSHRNNTTGGADQQSLTHIHKIIQQANTVYGQLLALLPSLAATLAAQPISHNENNSVVADIENKPVIDETKNLSPSGVVGGGCHDERLTEEEAVTKEAVRAGVSSLYLQAVNVATMSQQLLLPGLASLMGINLMNLMMNNQHQNQMMLHQSRVDQNANSKESSHGFNQGPGHDRIPPSTSSLIQGLPTLSGDTFSQDKQVSPVTRPRASVIETNSLLSRGENSLKSDQTGLLQANRDCDLQMSKQTDNTTAETSSGLDSDIHSGSVIAATRTSNFLKQQEIVDTFKHEPKFTYPPMHALTGAHRLVDFNTCTNSKSQSTLSNKGITPGGDTQQISPNQTFTSDTLFSSAAAVSVGAHSVAEQKIKKTNADLCLTTAGGTAADPDDDNSQTVITSPSGDIKITSVASSSSMNGELPSPLTTQSQDHSLGMMYPSFFPGVMPSGQVLPSFSSLSRNLPINRSLGAQISPPASVGNIPLPLPSLPSVISAVSQGSSSTQAMPAWSPSRQTGAPQAEAQNKPSAATPMKDEPSENESTAVTPKTISMDSSQTPLGGLGSPGSGFAATPGTPSLGQLWTPGMYPGLKPEIVHKGQQVYGKTPLGYICLDCFRQFNSKNVLDYHQRKYCHGGMLPLVCKICNRTFGQKCSLDSHMVTHTKEKNYRCPLCDKHFTRASTVKIHLDTVHQHDTRGPINLPSTPS